MYNPNNKPIITDQSVKLMKEKVTIDADQWNIRNGNVYTDADNDHVSSYVDTVLWRLLHLTAYYYSGYAVLIVEKEEEEMVGRQFNSFEELEPSAGSVRAYVGCSKSIQLAVYQ